MDTLEECGITYLTAASLQLWREAPAVWALRYLFGIHSYKLPKVARSVALKDGLRAYLHTHDESLAEDTALEAYERKLVDWCVSPSDPDARSQHCTILPMISVIVKEIKDLGIDQKPLAFSIARHVPVDWAPVPLLSVVDFVFADRQLKIKFTDRRPSAIKPRDLASLAIDVMARNQPPQIVYVTHKHAGWHEPTIDELYVAQRQLQAEAEAMEVFLLSAQTREHALAMLPLNHEHWAWKPGLLEAASNIITQSKEKTLGLICTERRRLSEGASRHPRGDLLPGPGSWDAEIDF